MAGPNERELRLKLTVVSDPSGGSKAMAGLAREAQKVEQAAGKAAQSLSQMFGGTGAGSGSAWSQVSAAANRAMPTMHSQVGAFQRPIPVIVVGPKPLQVEGVGKGKGGPGGGGQPREKEEKKEDPLAKTLSILRNLGLGGVAGNIGTFQGYGEALNEMGYKRGGAFLTRNAVGLGVAKSGLETAGNVAAVLHDSYLTGQQKARAIVREVPGGSWVQRLFDQFGGRAADMEVVRARAEMRRVEAHQRIELAGFGQTWNPEYAATVARANQLRRAQPVLEGAINRETALGQREFAERQRVLPLEREQAKLARETAVAVEHERAAKRELEGREGRALQLQRELAQLRAREREGGSGVERQQILTRIGVASEELQATLEQGKQARMGFHAAQLRTAEAQRAQGVAGVELGRARADILEERAATAAGGARALGGMNPIDRAWAVEAVKMVQQYGPDMVPPEILARAQAVAGNTIGKITEARGERTREFQELTRLAPADFAGRPEELREQAQQLRDEAAGRELNLEREAAKAGERAGEKIAGQIRGAINRIADEIIRQVEEKLKTGKGFQ